MVVKATGRPGAAEAWKGGGMVAMASWEAAVVGAEVEVERLDLEVG